MPLTREFTEASIRALNQRKTMEILCDYPGCKNNAVHVVGVVRDINVGLVVCEEHSNFSTHTDELNVRP